MEELKGLGREYGIKEDERFASKERNENVPLPWLAIGLMFAYLGAQTSPAVFIMGSCMVFLDEMCHNNANCRDYYRYNIQDCELDDKRIGRVCTDLTTIVFSLYFFRHRPYLLWNQKA